MVDAHLRTRISGQGNSWLVNGRKILTHLYSESIGSGQFFIWAVDLSPRA